MGLKKPDSKIKKPAQTGSSNLTSKPKSSAKSGPKRKTRPAITAKPEIKTKRTSAPALKKKKRTYTAEELGVPSLNGIVPVGVQKPKGKKIGKVFIDDAKTMMAILAVVNAEKEGERESKIMKSRQLEEIREAKREEAERRQDFKKKKLEETKDQIRRERRRKPRTSLHAEDKSEKAPDNQPTKPKKRVSFG